jgi:hypothetical protein
MMQGDGRQRGTYSSGEFEAKVGGAVMKNGKFRIFGNPFGEFEAKVAGGVRR